MLTLRPFPRFALSLVLLPAALTAQPRPEFHRVAVAVQRIDLGRMDVQVFQGKRVVPLPQCREIIVVKPVNHDRTLDYLAQESIVLVPSDRHPHEWNVLSEAVPGAAEIRPAAFLQAFSGAPLSLPDNVYMVRLVIVSSRQQPVAVKADSELYRLETGPVLLVLD